MPSRERPQDHHGQRPGFLASADQSMPLACHAAAPLKGLRATTAIVVAGDLRRIIAELRTRADELDPAGGNYGRSSSSCRHSRTGPCDEIW